MKKKFFVSLRVKIVLAVIMPIILFLGIASYLQYSVEREVLMHEIEETALQFSSIFEKSMEHAWMENDMDMIRDLTMSFENRQNEGIIARIRIFGDDHQLIVDSTFPEGVGSMDTYDVRESNECSVCHVVPSDLRGQVARLSSFEGQMVVALPITNQNECQSCHTEEANYLGMMLLDIYTEEFEEHIRLDLRQDIFGGVIEALFIMTILLMMFEFVVIRRVNAFQNPLNNFFAGDLSPRLPEKATILDEISELAVATNLVFSQLDEVARKEKLLTQWKEEAIASERKRIAHELHDGLVQILGYIKNKTKAIRISLKSSNYKKADGHLEQLENAAHEISLDVRDTIFGLRMTDQVGKSLEASLKELTKEFMKRNDVRIEYSFSPEANSLSLEPEIKYQILRIAQEALTNVRKHSKTDLAFFEVVIVENCLRVLISDQGQGVMFAVEDPPKGGLGIKTMKERAKSIGGDLIITSTIGQGTVIIFVLPIPERME